MNLVPLLARNWPFANGSGRMLDKFTRKIDLGTGERETLTNDGFTMHVYADDLIGRHILLSGAFDRSIVQVLLDHARPGDVLLDIGANIGYVSAVFLQRISNSKAICIEPQPGVVDLLRRNLAQFGARVSIEQFGLADKDGTLRFEVNAANRGASRVSADGETEIEVRNAGPLLAAMPSVDLIKIDVEGLEEPIFRSIEEELKRLKPRAILFEDQTGSASPESSIGAILTRTGYRIYGIEKLLMKTGLVPINSRADCRFNDYIALRG